MSITLHNGDCLDVMPTLPAGSVDLILCDLPYGTTQNKWDSVLPMDRLWAEYWRIAKPNAAVVLTATQPFTSTLVASEPGAFRYAWVWEKDKATGHLNAKRMPMKLHEDIVVFPRESHSYFPQDLIPFGKVTKRGSNGTNFGASGTENFQEFTNYPRSILRFAGDVGAVHPTQKPVALFEYLIRTYTSPGDLVLDNCMGSGTTGVAAVNTNRSFVGIERDESYFAIATDRIARAMYKPRVRLAA